MIHCPICDSRKIRTIGTLKGSRTGRRSPLYLCLDCYSLCQRPEYHEDDETLRGDLGWHVDKLDTQKGHSDSIIHQMLQVHPRAQTLLDIGCGIGLTVLAARQLGLDSHGIEPNPYAVKYARDKLSLDLVQDYFRADLFSTKFDLVIADMVLEHVPAPRDFIVNVFSILNPGGCFFVAVPDRLGGIFRILYSFVFPRARYSIFQDNDVHINHFSRKGVMKLATQNGAVLRAQTETGSYIFQVRCLG